MGGHAVNDVVRINQENVEKTLESIQTNILDGLGIIIGDNAKVLGSTGKRHPGDSSGDIDIAISLDAVKERHNVTDDEAAIDVVLKAVREITPDISDNSKSGMIHFSHPIANTDGKQKKEKVQVDFMLVADDDLNYVEFGYWSPAQADSEYKGAFRNIALMMIASEGAKKVLESQPDSNGEDVPVKWERMILDPRKGLFGATQTNLSNKTGKITRTNRTLSRDFITKDPNEIVKKLLGKSASMEDSQSFEKIIEVIHRPDFAFVRSRESILKRIAQELMSQFKLSQEQVSSILGVQNEEMTEASKGVDASKGVSHLEFIDDMIFNLGGKGLDLAVDTTEKMLNDLNKEGNVGDEIHKSSKIDGAPSLYFGRTPEGKFFVSTKAIHNKTPKLGFSPNDIRKKWGADKNGTPEERASKEGLIQLLTTAWKLLKDTVKEKGVILNGDMLFSSKNQKEIRKIEGEEYLTFRPNTILYAMPVDKKSEIFKRAKSAQLGIAIHSAFKADNDESGRMNLGRLGTKEIIDRVEKIGDSRVYAMHPFIPRVDMSEVLSENADELQTLITELKTISKDIDPEFDKIWNDNSDPLIKHIKGMMQRFLKAEAIKGKGNIYSAKDIDRFINTFKRNLSKWIFDITKTEKPPKTTAGIAKRAELAKNLKEWVVNSDETFDVFIRSYFYLYNIKVLLLSTFNNLKSELGKTFVLDDKSNKLIATKPEGYVLLNGPNMVKIVDREEFTKNNLEYGKFSATESVSGGSTGDPESIGDKKPIRVKSLSEDIYEDVMSAITSTQEVTGFNEVDAVNRADQTKGYNVFWVGKMQPPTKVHLDVLSNLSKTFNKVLLLVTDTSKYVDSELSVDLIKSAINKKNLQNVEVRLSRKLGAIDPLKSTFGLSSKKVETAKESANDLMKFFDLDEDDKSKPFVLAQGQEEKGKKGEEDRFNKIKQSGTLFIVNDGESPSNNKPFGLYGIPIMRDASGLKLGASMIRELISNNELEEAKEAMAPGDDDIKDQIIDSMVEKSQVNEEYFDIDGFCIDKEIISSISEEYNVDQAEAMDLILDILQIGE